MSFKSGSENDPAGSRKKSIFNDVEKHISGIIDGDLKVSELLESGVKSLTDGAKTAIDLITEFTRVLRGVKSFKVLPRPPWTLEVDICCKEPFDIPVNKTLFPFVELQSLAFGEHINFETLMNTTKKGLQLNVNEGMDLRFNLGPLGVQTLPLKGNVLLTHDENGELALITNHAVPGTSEMFNITIPIQRIIKKQFGGG